ncbi:tripeptidyl aminopeptidase [Fusarium beomiforme]|uniref:Tripeptidyl aminopeptidase n=1 Tax=Fusarium beomiforme TaxID=44412 RepID=A0A9P5E3V6_9HYPO|nr:tripeptidyl aminopeptidase [Fusarium beomiforme]
MKFMSTILTHLFLQSTQAALLPEDGPATIPEARDSLGSSIVWTKCKLPKGLDSKRVPKVDCASLPVPLDYTKKYSGKDIQLDLIRFRATKKPFKGSIIVNPGGPGGSGVQLVLGRGPQMAKIVGGHHDIIGFDPRGTGNTLLPSSDPGFVGLLLSGAYGLVQQARSDQEWMDYAWQYTGNITETFFVVKPENMRFYGTAFVARDILAIANALGEGRKINYWGMSYGTVLGQVLASMFPDRIGRMLLDGNLLADDYVTNFGANGIRETEKALTHFSDQCISAGPEMCSVATELSKRGGILQVFGYVELAHRLKSALNSDLNKFNISSPFGESEENGVSHLAILCGDSSFRAESPGDLFSFYQDQRSQSPFVDAELLSSLPCVQWKVRAAEPINLRRLQKVETKSPILIVNGAYDPVTPLGDA